MARVFAQETYGDSWEGAWRKCEGTASSLAITTHSESIDERCQRLQQEWVDAEFARMTSAYETTASVDQIAGAVGPLCYAIGRNRWRKCEWQWWTYLVQFQKLSLLLFQNEVPELGMRQGITIVEAERPV